MKGLYVIAGILYIICLAFALDLPFSPLREMPCWQVICEISATKFPWSPRSNSLNKSSLISPFYSTLLGVLFSTSACMLFDIHHLSHAQGDQCGKVGVGNYQGSAHLILFYLICNPFPSFQHSQKGFVSIQQSEK